MKKQLLTFAASVLSTSAVLAQQTCATSQVITAGTYNFASVDGTDVPAPVCATGGGGATAGKWYKYTPTQSLQITVTTDFPTINGNIDNRVHVYTGTCGALTCHAGDDDGGTGTLCVVTFSAIANTDYYIAFDNRWENTGFTFELIENPMPPSPNVSFVAQSFPNILGQYKIAIADMNGDYLDDIVSISSTTIHIL